MWSPHPQRPLAEIIQSPDLDLHLDGLASRSGAGKIALEWRDRGVGVFYMPSHKIVTSMHSTGITLLNTTSFSKVSELLQLNVNYRLQQLLPNLDYECKRKSFQLQDFDASQGAPEYLNLGQDILNACLSW